MTRPSTGDRTPRDTMESLLDARDDAVWRGDGLAASYLDTAAGYLLTGELHREYVAQAVKQDDAFTRDLLAGLVKYPPMEGDR